MTCGLGTHVIVYPVNLKLHSLSSACVKLVRWMRRWSFGILMYELVYGFTPFRGAKRDQTFENILKRPLVFPQRPEISKPCQVPKLIHHA